MWGPLEIMFTVNVNLIHIVGILKVCCENKQWQMLCCYIHRDIIIMGKALEDFSHQRSWCHSVWELVTFWVKVELPRQLAMMLPPRLFTS
jgi:hypothetical protein